MCELCNLFTKLCNIPVRIKLIFDETGFIQDGN
jgi:hypothetical protein